ncbi:hypothetical protein CXB51_005742 [Gossypium anomalum]|uniref:Integrase catalytic domain-containing protein n=1 Tax=Gossypium anomalum TaxID=47600 RepID=A0A8J5Z1F4_9ROSI|nr:hypothetical protein CXB51_005742 [Gossypium anomalum]
MKTSYLNDIRYFVLFIDDFSRFCWVHFLKQKSKVFEEFSKFKALAENQSSCKIKALRLDNGAEYLSDKFQKLCEQKGIHHQLTTVYTPQQNEVCERKNRTLLDMARCLLFQSKLPSKIWAEVVNTLVSTKRAYRAFDPSTKKIMPSNFDEAAREDCWKKAMEAEIEMIHKNDTSELVEKPEQKKVIGVKWVFRVKYNVDGSLNKHKAILVVKGYSQQYGIDFIETFAPVARLDAIKLLFTLAAQKGWRIHQLDAKSTFLNGFLKEEIFIEQLERFKVHGEEDKVYKLKKALYGLKQAPRAWYDRVDTHLSKLGFEKSVSEPTLYVKKSEHENLLIVSLYVDDLLVTGSKEELIDGFKMQMQNIFEMTDLGEMIYFLGMEVNQSDHAIFISQHAFAQKILKKFCMSNCKTVSTPVAQGVKLTSNSSHERVDEKEYQSLKRVLRYVKGTLNFGVKHEKAKELKLIVYSDSDWAGPRRSVKLWPTTQQETSMQTSIQAEPKEQ